MSFGFPNEEDDDFGALSNKSNLASIFHELDVQQSSSKSLVYTAPKQPPSKPLLCSMSQPVVVAAAVMCYKLNNEKYEPLPGKIGMALLGENESKTYQVILYQDKQRPLTSARITSDFMIISQPNNFCTFNDDHRQNWAVLFDTKEVAQKFLGEIDHIKKMLAEHTKNLVTECVIATDKIDGSASSPVENRMPGQDGSNKTKLMSRMAKLGQPILPLNGAIVADDSDHEQVIQSSPEPEPHKERSKAGKPPRPVPTPRIVAQSDRSDFNSSFTSVLVPSHQPSAGQHPYPVMQFLPPAFAGAVGGNSQHFDTLMSENRMHSSEVRMHLCRLTDKIDLLVQKTGGCDSYQKDRYKPSEQPHWDALTTGLQKLQAQSNEHSNMLNLILGEISASGTRGKNSANPLESLDHLLASERQAWAANQKELEGTIQRLKEENNRLLQQIEEKSEREKEIDIRIQQLQDENARFKEDLKLITHSQNDETLDQLRKENTQLAALLDASLVKEKKLASQHDQMQEKLDSYESKSTKVESLLLESERLAEKKEQRISQLQEHIKKLEKQSSDARSVVEDLQSKLKDAEKEIQNKYYSDQEQGSLEEQVKVIMNKVYKEITKKFIPGESYAFHSIKSTVSTVIRDFTLAVLSGESTAKPMLDSEKVDEKDNDCITPLVEEVSVEAVDTAIQEDNGPSIAEENGDSVQEKIVHTLQPENESRERSVSFLESLHSSLAAASLQNEHETVWKPDPPPPPLFDDFDNEDDWLA
ncbi:FK506-binding protein 15-like [Daphnia carinata]|uniref:FK506-binding protein 15-like n=1 Tax=Daphnia carinata TaxID=120202 RepID=UPI00257E531A|nr:FK506-binding protein 15-like [Daphnia carinata]